MKKILSISFVILSTLTTLGETIPSGRPVLILKPRDPVSQQNRPKSPSRQEVTCLYIEDSLYINFAIPEGECDLYLYDLTTGETISATFDSYESEPIYIGYHNSAEITINTQSGNSYTGTW